MVLDYKSVARMGSLRIELDKRGVKAGFRNFIKVRIKGIILSFI
jgi:hypothetical protein